MKDVINVSRIRLQDSDAEHQWLVFELEGNFSPAKLSCLIQVVNIQVGYCMSDIISKCGVGLIIYQVSYAKSAKEALLPQ